MDVLQVVPGYGRNSQDFEMSSNTFYRGAKGITSGE